MSNPVLDGWHTLTVEQDGDGFLFHFDHPESCPPASDDPDVLFSYRCLTEAEFFESDHPSDDERASIPGAYQVRGHGQLSGWEPEWEQWIEWADPNPVERTG